MNEPNYIAGSKYLDFSSAVEAIIRRSCIIDYGIIQNIPAEGVVDVAVAVSDTPQNMFCMTCVLANIASTSLTIKVKPSVGDRVLVVYPRMYDDNMFTVPDSDTEKKKVIVNPQAKGYNLCSGIAILINQYKSASHKNVITVDGGNVTAKLNKVEVTTTADGDISLKNPKAEVTIDKDGNVKVNAQGKYTLKNATKDLLTVISNLNTVLQGLKTTGSSSEQAISPDTIAQLVNWENTDLKALLAST